MEDAATGGSCAESGRNTGHAMLCPLWPVTRKGAGGLTHQNEGVHDIFTDLQTRGACYFQKQIGSCFLNLKKISEKE